MKDVNNKLLLTFFLAGVQIHFASCERLIEVSTPSTSTNSDVIYSADATSAAVMTNVYAQMNAGLSGVNSISVYPELSGDNLTLFATNNAQYALYYKNALSPFSTAGVSSPSYWNLIYALMYNVNAVIEGTTKATTLTKALKDQLLGEAFFMRAFFYFYLTNIYGDVPLITTTSFNATSTLPRSGSDKIYEQIISDLTEAKSLLNENYIDATLVKSTSERLRPNKYAAFALLARIYLFKGDYINAEAEATKVINQKILYDTIPVNSVFIRNSKETIWALQPVKAGENTPEAKFYILPASGPNLNNNPVYLSDRLMMSFEPGDQRKAAWTLNVAVSGKIYPYAAKYRIIAQNTAVNEYSIVLRLSEQYLIRAEARIQQNNIAGTQSDLNSLRIRAGLGTINDATKDDLLSAILKERRVELFTEWGHRWFDLKRSGIIDDVMTSVAIEKGSTWKSDWQLYPVPAVEIQNNPNLSQNDGYQK